jgi:hypothetical protein
MTVQGRRRTQTRRKASETCNFLAVESTLLELALEKFRLVAVKLGAVPVEPVGKVPFASPGE